MKALRPLAVCLLACSLVGCSNIRYAIDDNAIPVAFSANSNATESRTVTSQTRSYFGIMSLLTYNTLVPGLGDPVKDLAQHAHAPSRLSNVAIVEEYSLIDFAVGLLVSVVGSTVTGGLAGFLYSGSRTSTLKAQAEEGAR